MCYHIASKLKNDTYQPMFISLFQRCGLHTYIMCISFRIMASHQPPIKVQPHFSSFSFQKINEAKHEVEHHFRYNWNGNWQSQASHSKILNNITIKRPKVAVFPSLIATSSKMQEMPYEPYCLQMRENVPVIMQS